MVPGLSERERRAADVQRLEWLADAVLGPTRCSGGRPLRIAGSAEAPRDPPANRGDAKRSQEAQISGFLRGLLRTGKRQAASASAS
jgi:hypothetical protein